MARGRLVGLKRLRAIAYWRSCPRLGALRGLARGVPVGALGIISFNGYQAIVYDSFAYLRHLCMGSKARIGRWPAELPHAPCGQIADSATQNADQPLILEESALRTTEFDDRQKRGASKRTRSQGCGLLKSARR